MTWIKAIPPKMMHDKLGIYSGMWMPEMDRCWIRKEDGCCVCSRLIRTNWGKVEHVTITKKDPNLPEYMVTNDGTGELTWSEKQQIKNELFGENRTAVEVFPEEDRLVDTADVYHLWVFEKHFRLPFGIHPKEIKPAINRGYSITIGEIEQLKSYYEEKEKCGNQPKSQGSARS